jgi:type IV secretory pathway protease TraF
MLATDEIFLLNPARDSLDSRYFGPFQKQSIVGRACAFWIRNDPDASHDIRTNF